MTDVLYNKQNNFNRDDVIDNSIYNDANSVGASYSRPDSLSMSERSEKISNKNKI